MTFTYIPSSTPNDVTRVRFHTGQTVEAESFVSDEEIEMMLAESATWQEAVITVIKFIMARLSQPNFRADWLQIDHESARKGYAALLAQKASELGVPAITARGQSVYRADSDMTDVPGGW